MLTSLLGGSVGSCIAVGWGTRSGLTWLLDELGGSLPHYRGAQSGLTSLLEGSVTSYLAVLVFGGASVGLAVGGGGVQEAFTWLLRGFVWSYLVVVEQNAWGLTLV